MTFRLRVLGLVVLVAVAATGATAWLTYRLASRAIAKSSTAAQDDVELITKTLVGYGRNHGLWEGVGRVVEDLATRTGQRIRLVTESNEVVVDSDHLAGRAARRVASSPVLIDPRPQLRLTTYPYDSTKPFNVVTEVGITVNAIVAYRHDARLAACLTRGRVQILVSEGAYGVPRLRADRAASDSPQTIDACEELAAVAVGDPVAHRAVAKTCDEYSYKFEQDVIPDEEAITTCLQDVFTRRISSVAAVPLHLYLGAVTTQPRSLLAGPTAVAAGFVLLLALAGTALVSRRVLRPIGRLTEAAARFGEGNLAERVAVSGRDELAALGRSFNRMADSIQRAEQRQRNMISDVAHELRTPLANLRGYLEALKDGVIGPSPELFSSLHEEAVLQQRIVEDLQTLALAEAGRLTYHRSVIDLVDLLEGCRAGHQAAAAEADLVLTVRPSGPVRAEVDPSRLRQVVGNLLSNAIRYTPRGGSIVLAAKLRPGTAMAAIAVSDTGSGIAESDLPFIFDRFWRADTARQRATGGSGLGLAIARQIVLDHAGTISVASQLGAGTTFTITLPVSAPPKPAGGTPRPGGPAPGER